MKKQKTLDFFQKSNILYWYIKKTSFLKQETDHGLDFRFSQQQEEINETEKSSCS